MNDVCLSEKLSQNSHQGYSAKNGGSYPCLDDFSPEIVLGWPEYSYDSVVDPVVARYYDATIGRFISADTIVPDWTNPQSLNRYIYCGNNPIKYTDPSGHDWLSDIGSAIAGGAKAAVDTVVDVGKTTCEFVAFSAKNMTTAEYWGDVGDMFLGYGDAIEGTLYGVMNTIHDPGGTAEGLVYAASNPGEAWDAISTHYSGLAQTDRGRGQIVGETLITLGSMGAATAVSGSSKAGNVLRLPASMADEASVYQSAASRGSLVRTQSSALPRSRARAGWERENGPVPNGYDIDHIIQRQFGGTDDLWNLQLKPSGLNRSQGSQAYHLNSGHPYGTVYNSVQLVGPSASDLSLFLTL